MLNQARLVAFIATSNPDRAHRFYGEQLGLKLVSDDPFALVFDANGTTIRVQEVERFIPQPFTVLGWIVSNLEQVLAELRATHIACEQFPGLEQDERGIWSAPSGAQVAWLKDPDGNVLSLTEL